MSRQTDEIAKRQSLEVLSIFPTVAKLQQAAAFMPRLRHKTLRNAL
jgi:hypothetical protein